MERGWDHAAERPRGGVEIVEQIFGPQQPLPRPHVFRARADHEPGFDRVERGRPSGRTDRSALCHKATLSRRLTELKNDAASEARVPAVTNAANHRGWYYNSGCYDNRRRGASSDGGTVEAERFRCLQVDDQLEFGRLLDRQITGLRPMQDLIDIITRRALPDALGAADRAVNVVSLGQYHRLLLTYPNAVRADILITS